MNSLRYAALTALLGLLLPAARAQPPRAQAFRAVSYDVAAALDPSAQSITAKAKVELQALEASRLVLVELHPNLKVTEVTTANGQLAPFTRDDDNPLVVRVTLPQPALAGAKTTLTFSYSGPLANDENSPVKGVRLASIGAQGAYLLQAARWFPLTGYPSNRYTSVFRIEVPENFAVAGTGKAATPTTVAPKAGAVPGNGHILYTFRSESPEAGGTFVAGNIQLFPQSVEGLNISVFAPPSAVGTAADYAADAARAVNTFSDLFGPIPNPHLTLIQLPDGSVRDFAAPGVLLVSQRAWNPKAGDRALSRLVAEQWWGNAVMPASPADVWVTDGLARYSEALYAEKSSGKEAGLRAVDEFAVGALMYEETAPIAQADRLQPFTSDYRSVVLNKGAMVFHMLRALLDDDVFEKMLRDFYAKFSGKTARMDDLENLAQGSASPVVSSTAAASPAPANLRPFFVQWLNSTGVPEFKLDYVIYRTPKGFRVVGKVKQDLETFRMPLEVKVDTEGNPEFKTIEVVGTDSDFSIDTFGRPKPGGITLDPNNVVLKASQRLRARAAIARGEELAEQGRYYDAIAQYQRALDVQKNSPLAQFRMGESFFYQKNYQAAANSFREALETVPDAGEKWTEVWAHIYLGKIFDIGGQRERAVNEYSKARQTNDDTGGAQAEAERLLAKPYSDANPSASAKS